MWVPNVRMAEVRINVLKKGKRKKELDFIHCVGLNDNEALQNLKTKFDLLKETWKDWSFSGNLIKVFDARVEESPTCGKTISHPILPTASDNLHYFPLTHLM